MQFVFSVRDALQIKAVIKKHMQRANSNCAMHGCVAAWCAVSLAHGLAWHRGPPLGQSLSWGSQENVKTAACKNGRISLNCSFHKRLFPLFTGPL